MCQRVEAMQTKLAQTKSALKDIEIQKEESINKFREQKTKYSQLNDELKKLKSKNEDKGRQAEIEKLISEMNKDLRQKYFSVYTYLFYMEIYTLFLECDFFLTFQVWIFFDFLFEQKQRSSVIQELTKQKRASDDMLRRLEVYHLFLL